MLRLALVFIAVHSILLSSWGQDCGSVTAQLKLPQKAKTRGNPKILKWEDVDKQLAEISKSLQGRNCSFTFGQVFNPKGKEEELYFPLTNSLVRIVPDASLEGLPVLTKEGVPLGDYVGRVRYERSGGLYTRDSYTLFIFQYRTESGRLQPVGNRLLLGDFAVPWAGVKDKVLIETGSE